MKPENIIIPRKVIGIDEGWEDEIRPILAAYVDAMGDELAEPVIPQAIQEAETRLGTPFPHDLKLFYLRFGPARLMEGLFDVSDFQYLTMGWGENMLAHYTAEEQEVLSKLIVFGNYLGNGNVWCFHKDSKAIFYYNHDSRHTINGMFSTFYQYIQALLIFSQGEMWQEEEGIYEACEARVVEMIGKDRVRVWQYFDGWD